MIKWESKVSIFGLLREENNLEMCHFKFAMLKPFICTARDN